MPIFTAIELQTIGTAQFDAVGSPHDESEWVTETLVRASLMGHDSHGPVRFTEYANHILDGEIKPGRPSVVVRETPTTAVLDAQLGWGQVAARRAMDMAIDKAARNGLGVVVVQNSPHAGRIGEYAAM